MPNSSRHPYQRCFISAPYGVDLAALPRLLGERQIAWEWAKDEPSVLQSATTGIEKADFVIIVLNGTRADYRGVFDAGIATGLRKPVLLVQTKSHLLPIDLRLFLTVKASLTDYEAIGFHLDLLLSSPHRAAAGTAVKLGEPSVPPRRHKPEETTPRFDSQLERRAYEAILRVGGTAVATTQGTSDTKFRPDFLAWLGHLDADLFDPVAIEIKGHIIAGDMQQLEERLFGFIQAARVQMALILTEDPTPRREQQFSPNVIWMSLDLFEELATKGDLGNYVRNARNRIVHGAR